MAIIGEREIARADMNDSYGVSVWQERKLTDYTTDEARQLAREIVAAADEAERIEKQDREAATGGHECGPFIADAAGKAVI